MKNKVRNTLTYLSGIYEEKRIRKITNYNINNEYKRIYFYHIRKAAGKSVTDIIMSLEGKDHYNRYGDLYSSRNHRIVYNDKVFVGWHPLLIQKGHYYYAFSHIPYHEINIPIETFTFTCLRDPVDRVISYYHMLHRLKEKNNNISSSLSEEIQYLGNSMVEFLDNIPKYRLLNQLYMFSKDYSIAEAMDKILNLSYFFFVDDFANGIKTLGEKLNLDLKVLHTDKAEDKDETPASIIHRLREVLQPEYELIENIK